MAYNERESLVLDSEVRRLLKTPPDGDFVAALRIVLKTHLVPGRFPLSQVARTADMSVRAVQRKLNAEGWTYSKLVEQARLELAMEMLKNKDLSLDEIAKKVGYSALPNFTRAFGRWTGKTPSEFRRSGQWISEDR